MKRAPDEEDEDDVPLLEGGGVVVDVDAAVADSPVAVPGFGHLTFRI
jgi:hypothetical protein